MQGGQYSAPRNEKINFEECKVDMKGEKKIGSKGIRSWAQGKGEEGGRVGQPLLLPVLAQPLVEGLLAMRDGRVLRRFRQGRGRRRGRCHRWEGLPKGGMFRGGELREGSGSSGNSGSGGVWAVWRELAGNSGKLSQSGGNRSQPIRCEGLRIAVWTRRAFKQSREAQRFAPQ